MKVFCSRRLVRKDLPSQGGPPARLQREKEITWNWKRYEIHKTSTIQLTGSSENHHSFFFSTKNIKDDFTHTKIVIWKKEGGVGF